ncbi:MAG: leucine--tRNA ligase, partial [Actinobacteria bacterium]|uniref:leucine--tRNA ligase n=1 Tax=freshwater metagenome TaxID=449393 RepID=A0A6J6N3D5_9ZZZZ|nr:leucine--tRNA ligase [Actinomycetota bacterium]
MRQWVMRITAYADRLISDLDRLDWPEPIKLMQRNWIGRSEGARVTFTTPGGPVEVFTTRPDTLFGATFLVLSPEHPLVDELTTASQKSAVAAYKAEAAAKQDNERQDDSKQKTGVFTGATATNPVSGNDIPIYIADYVLMGYGTGAIMAVPAGDQRDFDFARTYNLPITAIQMPSVAWFDQHAIASSADCSTWPNAFVGDGVYINSENGSLSLNGLASISEATKVINAWLAENNCGEPTVTYRLRDWLFSRQRYWGEPFPIVYDEDGRAHAVPTSALPVLLPELADFKPTTLDPNDANSDPIPPLARVKDWTMVSLDLGDGMREYRREVNVMPQWAGSCWYEMRYLDPTNTDAFINHEVERYWMGPQGDGHTGGADLYVGGVEHAVLHLLYARFWHKVLHDLGHVSSEEPFHRLFNQGYIQAYAYRDDRGQTVPAAEVIETDGVYSWEGETVAREYGKMGKSLKNIVTPDEMYEEFGADTFRLYEMAMGPLDASRPWNTRDVVGMQRFLQRLWRNVINEDTGDTVVTEDEAPEELMRHLHRTIVGVDADLQHLRFNTAIAKLIEFNNALTGLVNTTQIAPRELVEPLVQMLSPLCPHIADELWFRLGHDTTVTYVPFPIADPALLVEDSIEVPVQVNGKVRARIQMSPTATEDEHLAAAMSLDAIISALDGRTPLKTIVVPGRTVNIVVK